MSRVFIPFLFFVCIFALPQDIHKRDVDKIAFPDELPASTTTAVPAHKADGVEDPSAPKGNGTDLDNRFLGVGLGLVLGKKLFGGHGGYYPQPHYGGYPQPYYGGGGFSGSQAQAQAQSQSFGGGFGGFGGSQSQAQAQSQSFGGGFGGGFNPYYG